MDEIEIKALLEAEIDNAIGYVDSETTIERARAMNYYLRNPYGNEIEGKSTIVTGEVAEAVDGALPQLMRVFTANEDAIRYEPEGEGDEPFADEATKAANWVFYKQNDGFQIFHDWFKDALLQKVGVVKAYWVKKEKEEKQKYKGLTDDEFALLLQDDDWQVVKIKTDEETIDNGLDAYGNLVRPPVIVAQHDVTLRRVDDESFIKIEVVPPEEFLISKRATTIADSPFVAHRRRITRGELVELGFDKETVDNLPANTELTYSPERLARYSNGEMPDDSSELDKSMQEVEVFECYIKADFNGNGLPELRKVIYAGNEILDNDECDYVPFHSLCPIPIPHKFFGNSLADRTMDIQLQKSSVTRQNLDNLYLINNYRIGAVEGQANLDDLLTSTAGGVVRLKNNQALVPIPVTSMQDQAYKMLDYLDQTMAKRTGISDMQQGLDPSVLQNTTATAVAAVMQQSTGKLELIARIFAETGVRSLFKGILHLMCKYQDKSKTVRMNGKYMTFDPRQWKHSYDVSINVGLGNGNRQEQIAMLQMIMAKQEEVITKYGVNNPLVSLQQYQGTMARMIEMAGFKDTTSFINEITPEIEAQVKQQASQQPPDPTTQAAELYAKVEQEKAQLKAQTEMAKLDLDREKMELENARKELELQQKEAKQQAELALQQIKISLGVVDGDEAQRTKEMETIIKAISEIGKLTKGGQNVQQ